MSADTQTASRGLGGQAEKPGPRKVYVGATILAIAIAAIVVLAIKPGGSSAPAVVNALHLPQTKVYGHVAKGITIPEPNQVPLQTATPQRPLLHQQQGYAVIARLSSGASTRVFMAGPLLAGSLANRVAQHKVSLTAEVPGTFTVRFSAVHGTVALDPGDFTILTYKGQIIVPRVTMADGGPLPTTLPQGRTLNLKLSAKVPEGDGTIRWSPGGVRILVGYFWTTEFD